MNSRHFVLCATAALLCSFALHAQSPTGEIRLSVQDSSGAAMQATGKLGTQSFQTDAQGQYAFQNLAYGRYRLEVTKAGFATQSATIDVRSGTPILRTVTMALATQTSRVDVVGATPLAGTDLDIDQVASAVQTATAADI